MLLSVLEPELFLGLFEPRVPDGLIKTSATAGWLKAAGSLVASRFRMQDPSDNLSLGMDALFASNTVHNALHSQ